MKNNIDNYLSQFFKGIPLKGKSVLDIGCGNGTLLSYVLRQGAIRAVGIEPSDIQAVDRSLNIRRVRFQDYLTSEKFDVIVLHNSINHLDEAGTINLHKDTRPYTAIGLQLRQLMAEDGLVVISDVARRNFWPDIHLKNPFAPTIEWHKHQSPYLWAKVLSLGKAKITWPAPSAYPFKWLLANRFVSYFLTSQFKLVIKDE